LAKVPLWLSVLVTTTDTTPPSAAETGVLATIELLFTAVTPVAAVPPKLTVAPAKKFVPVIVTPVPPPAGPVLGTITVSVGAGLLEV
jgi:hypothetical protein